MVVGGEQTDCTDRHDINPSIVFIQRGPECYFVTVSVANFFYVFCFLFVLVAFHFFRDTTLPNFNRFAAWGGVQLTFFFMLSGFVLAYQYSDLPEIKSTGTFVFRRWSRLYPSFALSLVLQLFVVPWDWRAFLTCVFCLNTWIPNQFYNVYNTPGWAVGAFLFQYTIFPVVIRPIAIASEKYRLWVLLPACIGLSMLEAAMASGVELFIYGGIINIFLKPRTSSFLFGVVLGSLFVDQERKRQKKEAEEEDEAPSSTRSKIMKMTSTLLSRIGFTALVGGLFCLFYFVDIEKLPYYLYSWADRGLLMLPFAGVIWYASVGKDLVLGCILGLRPLVAIGTQASYGVYIFQSASYSYTTEFFIPMLEDAGVDIGFATLICVSLLVFAFIVHNLFEGPVSFILQVIHRGFVHRRRERAAAKKEKKAKKMLANTPLDLEPDRVKEDARLSKLSENFKVALYYTAMAATFSMFIIWTIWRPKRVTNGVVDVEDEHVANFAINTIKLFAVIAIPALLFNISGHLFFPPIRRVKVPSLYEQASDETKSLKARLFFRIVTRGNNPNLVLQNVVAAVKVLQNTGLPSSQWTVEVATDNPLNLDERTDLPCTELLTPEDYVCPNGGKYKARALEYAVKISEADRHDWVIHMDEESRIEEETVKYIYAHCAREEALVLAGKKEYGNIGQGVILYGTAKYPENYLTTLADSIRVSDDFGKFRTQYELHEPFIGMHGSFVVCQSAIEEDVSFDHGLAGSITEDAYFALAASGIGVKFSWIDAFMYEQSPFSVMDFIKQRARWFGGLWLVVLARSIPWKRRATLAFMTCSWLCSPIVLIAMTLSMLVTTERTAENVVIIVFVGAASCWGYLLGFVWTFKPEHGYARYAFLFFAQLALQPVFAFMETAGILHAIIFPPVKGFYIVQKEGGIDQEKEARMDGSGYSSGSMRNGDDDDDDASVSSRNSFCLEDDKLGMRHLLANRQDDAPVYFLRPKQFGGGKANGVEIHVREFAEF